MNLWLDDIRPAPDGWIWARTAKDAIRWLRTGKVVECSLDHDLGWCVRCGSKVSPQPICVRCKCACHMTGYQVTLWMAKRNVWPSKVSVHSANPVGRQRMIAVIEKYAPTGTLYSSMPACDPRYC